jgi:tetratricopeptide (TPR) repeat protein
MTVDVYLCDKFQHRHERKAFSRFLQEMLDRYRESPDYYLIIGEPEANTASMDLIVLSQCALIAVELKELTYAEGIDLTDIYLAATEKGTWEYRIENGSTYQMGGVGKERNPYQQVKDHNYKLRDWLVSHPEHLPGAPWDLKDALQRIYSWVVISPGFNTTVSNLDLPWKEISKWFKLLTIDQLAWEIGLAANEKLEFSPEQMIGLATQLGGVRRENLQEFVPNYVPPAPRLSFFSRPPICKRIVNRIGERDTLLESLKDPQVSVICIGGAGGIGKTHLASWLSGEATTLKYKVAWIECNEREVTQESFLSAVADKMPDKYQAALVHDPELRNSDKLEIALEFLDQEPYLLIFNDYHRIPAAKGLDELFTRIIHKTTKIKILLTTRVRPDCMDSPEWTPGSVAELALGGLPFEVMREYISVENLTDDQLRHIWERTSGNPYAIGLFTSMLRNRRTEEDLSKLPLFSDERAVHWAESLITTLSGEVRTLATKIAVVRTPLSMELIERLTYTARDRVYGLIRALIDQYVLHEAGADEYIMHDYVREALISKAAEKDLRKAHQTAGSCFEKLAKLTGDVGEKIEIMLQALYHYEQGQNWPEVLELAGEVYDCLVGRGDRERSCNVASLAVRAARVNGDTLQIADWMVKQIKRELDLRRIDEAQKHLNDAFNFIPKSEKKIQGTVKARWQSLEAQLWVQKGRYAHLTRDHARVDEDLRKAVELANASGDRSVIADTLFRVAQFERLHRDYESAKTHSEEAGNLANKLGDHHLLAMCISQLGLIVRDLGDLEEARRLFLLAQEKARLAGDLNGIEINAGLLGDILLRLREYECAEQVFREQIQKAQAVGNSLGTRINLGWLIDALIGSQKLQSAEEYLREFKQRSDDARDEIGEAFYYKRMGQIEQGRGQIEKGNELIQIGIQKLQETGNETYIPDFEKALIKHLVPKQLPFWDENIVETKE